MEDHLGESAENQTIAEQLARAIGSPFVPAVLSALEMAEGYLEHVWPQLEPSVATQGFLGSALYMADMASDEIEASYESGLSRSLLIGGGLAPDDLDRLLAVLDVFHCC